MLHIFLRGIYKGTIYYLFEKQTIIYLKYDYRYEQIEKKSIENLLLCSSDVPDYAHLICTQYVI